MGLMDMLSGLMGGKAKRGRASAGAPDLGDLGALSGLLKGLGGGGGGGGNLLAALLPMLMGGGMGGLLGKLQGGGHANKVASWVGTGPNDDIDPDELEQAIGQDEIARLARDSGMSHSEAKSGLAKLLPGVVDQLSPKGSLPQGGGLDDALGKLKGLLG